MFSECDDRLKIHMLTYLICEFLKKLINLNQIKRFTFKYLTSNYGKLDTCVI